MTMPARVDDYHLYARLRDLARRVAAVQQEMHALRKECEPVEQILWPQTQPGDYLYCVAVELGPVREMLHDLAEAHLDEWEERPRAPLFRPARVQAANENLQSPCASE